ncbi:MAG: SDR family oxidoreductase [Dehalococcoidia bacterium]|nr:SDR family oxidoreductase [Dehalococcoidia bacterium]
MTDKQSSRVVLITGASRGIGLAVAEAFARNGDIVSITGGRDRQALDDAVGRLRSVQPDASGAMVDAKNKAEVDGWLAATVSRWGRIDCAVANAGVINPTPFLDITEEQWDTVVGTHLKGTFLLMQGAGRVMAETKTGGSLITVSAPAALRASNGVADYASAKGGIIALTRNLSKELAPFDIRVNCISPVAETRMTDALQVYRKLDAAAWARLSPGGRMPQPHEITEPFLFLCSPGARFITGQVIAVDAGRSV